MSNKIKVLMILGSPKREGAQTFAVNVLKFADKNLFQIDFAFLGSDQGGYRDEILDNGAKIFAFPRYKVYNHFSFKKNFRKFLKDNKYDIVHGNVAGSASVYLKIAKKCGCKTIRHSHNSNFRGSWFEKTIKKSMNKSAKKYADYWFACSDLAAVSCFGENYNSNPNYLFIPNPIDSNSYRFSESYRNEIRNKYNISADTRVYGNVSSFSPVKNHNFLLDIFNSIVSKDSNSVLMLVGDGQLKEQIKSKIDKLGLQDKVVLTGSVSDVNKHLMAMDVFVFPSFFEGFPISLIEATADGLQCLISDTISENVKIADNIEMMSLTKSADKWADKATSMNSVDRIKYCDIVKKSRYDVSTGLNELYDIYKKIML